MRLAHVRDRKIGRRTARAATAPARPSDPDDRHPGDEEQRRPQPAAISTVWPTSGCMHQQRQHAAAAEADGDQSPGIAGRSAPLGEQPGRRPRRRRASRIPTAAADRPSTEIQRRAPLTSAPKNSVATISATEIAEHDQRRGAGPAAATANDTPIITMQGERRNMTLALGEVERSAPMALGRRRAGGDSTSDGADHAPATSDAGQHQPVDGPPPVADRSSGRCAQRSCAPAWHAAARRGRGRRRRAPRSWGTGRRRRRPATAARRARPRPTAAASRAAAGTAASSVPRARKALCPPACAANSAAASPIR